MKINQFTWMHFEIILSGDSLQIIFAYIYISKTDIFFSSFLYAPTFSNDKQSELLITGTEPKEYLH